MISLVILFCILKLCSGELIVSVIASQKCVPHPSPLKNSINCVKPDDLITFHIQFNSTVGEGTELVLENSVACVSNSCWSIDNATVPLTTANGTFSADFYVFGLPPSEVGFHEIAFKAVMGTFACPAEVCEIVFPLEVTCSDGIFCNGEERYSGGVCVPGPAACNDGTGCTTDTCDEETKRCDYRIIEPLAVGCARCNGACVGDCTGKICGDDGCGGSCGTCAATEACNASFMCTPFSSLVGTCANPIEIGGLINVTNFGHKYTLSYDNSKSVHLLVPSCNSASTAPELVFHFKTPNQYIGFDIRMLGLDTGTTIFDEEKDTLLEMRHKKCTSNQENTVGYDATIVFRCSDDSAPPGGVASRVHGIMEPNTDYYLIADAYSADQVGEFNLTLVFSNDCDIICDGMRCGEEDQCGVSCGDCAVGEECNPVGHRCRAVPCVPDCVNRTCGDDGCDGSCGNCTLPELCASEPGIDYTNWTCLYFKPCNPFTPDCDGACSTGEFCGTDCSCHDITESLPDLVVDSEVLKTELYFTEEYFSSSSCAVYEKCLTGTGKRSLIRFSTLVVNQGQAALFPPLPKEAPNLFIWSPCHGHYHYETFANYWLLDSEGKVAVVGRKMGYCMEDSYSVFEGPLVPCESQSDCNVQGLSVGWGDVYGFDLDCQWLDITGTPPGNYTLRIAVNTNRYFQETTYDNNYAEVIVIIPDSSASICASAALMMFVIFLMNTLF